jgi:hypothetical protein
VTDGTCNQADCGPAGQNPGGGTIINSVTISGAGWSQIQRRTAIVDPGETFTVSGTADEPTIAGLYSAGLLGIGPNATAGTGRSCRSTTERVRFHGRAPPTPAGVSFGTQSARRTRLALLHPCHDDARLFLRGATVGPPESSVRESSSGSRYRGRRAVDWPMRAPTTTAQCTWNPSRPRTQVSGVEDDRILLVAEGATGLDRAWVATSPGTSCAWAEPCHRLVCPATAASHSGGLTVSCTPWEARVVTDPINAIPVVTT